MTFLLHELSLNQQIQQEVRDNINKVLQKYNGKLTYEALSEMDVLERCINGTFFYIQFLFNFLLPFF